MDRDTQNLIDAGNDILKSVTKAIDTNDYSKLASEISSTVKNISFDRKTTYSSGRREYNQGVNQTGSYANRTSFKNIPFLQKKIGRYDGIVSLILGGFTGLFIGLPVFLGLLSKGSVIGALVGFAIAAASAYFAYKGRKRLKLSKAYYKYGNILQGAEYFKISDLAQAAVETDEEVLKNVKGNVEFNIYGNKEEPEYWEKCEREITELPSNIHVEYRGAYDHSTVFELMAQNHIFFFPTLSENYGHVIAEAMLAGLPVVISDQTPWNDVNEAGAGHAIPLDQEIEFIESINRYVDMGEGQYLQVVHNVEDYVGEKLSLDKLSKKYSDLFKQVIGQV